MKITKFLPVLILAGSLLLSACSGVGMPFLAPAKGLTDTQANPISEPVTSSSSNVNAQTATDVAALQSAYEAVYQKVNPSVVTIEISRKLSDLTGLPGSGRQSNGQNDQVMPVAEGSGFVWDTDGHIVTNNHVVDGADKIRVAFSDGSSYEAKLIGTDPNTDLAVIQVTTAPASLLKPITVGDSTQVNVGEMVVAIGNPFGLANTMTTGIVSAISRSIPARADNSQDGSANTPSFSIPDVIQTDAAINPGNSGGVLVDMNGALIGVPSQIASASGSNSGIGFAIPSAMVNKVVPQLISSGKAVHSYLGISGTTLTPDLASLLNLEAGQQGVVVATVVSDGPAEAAGLKPTEVDENGTPTSAGDIITGIDGKSVNRFEDLVSYLYSSTQPGQSVTLTVLRGGSETQVKVTLGTQPTQ